MQLPDLKIKCPYTAFKMKCFDGVTKHGCPKWVEITGTNPQTGEMMHRSACAGSMAHFLLLENSQMQRQTAAAIDSFRNEMVQLNRGPLAPALPRGQVNTNALNNHSK